MTAFPPLVSRLIPSLGRDNDNEVVTTVRAIGSALRSVGLDWFDVAAACAAAPASASISRRMNPRPAFGDLARAVRDLDDGELTSRERGFVLDMCRRGWGFSPTPRQSEWLSRLFDRLSARRAAA